MKKLALLSEKLNDDRGREVIFVSHCLLNTNTRYLGGAFRRGPVGEIIQEARNKGIGIVQIDCPERRAWGGILKKLLWIAFDLKAPLDSILKYIFLSIFVIYTRLIFRRIAASLVRQIYDYLKSGFSVRGIIGVDGSPSCGINLRLNLKKSFAYFSNYRMDTLTREDFNRGLYEKCAEDGSGIFFEEIKKQLRKRHIEIPLYAYSLIEEMQGGKIPVKF